MAIRIRTVGETRVALCAAETDERPGDVYLDDAAHYALAAKFRLDWKDQQLTGWPEYPVEWAAMETQKLRDAEATLTAWLDSQP
ncbi:hypothetical protein NKI61_27355 [Mesorhizobium sp. M0514]|uniref:hypothetical protein n=1 Tax=Mesorhizobium sp. M0514 TaxID=2956955 RepID=UPI00333C2B10